MALFCCLVTTHLHPSLVNLLDLNRNVERDQSKLAGKTDFGKLLGSEQEAIYSVNYIIPSVLELEFPFTWVVMLLWPHPGSTHISLGIALCMYHEFHGSNTCNS